MESKDYKTFIVPIEVAVQSVVGYTSSTSFTPVSERVFGGSSPVYQGGQSSHLEIIVDRHPIVKKVLFAGLPSIEEGDIIRAYVFKAKVPEDTRLLLEIHNISSLSIKQRIPPKYVVRDFKPEERAFKIEKLRRKVLPEKVNDDAAYYQVRATYIDVDLSKF